MTSPLKMLSESPKRAQESPNKKFRFFSFYVKLTKPNWIETGRFEPVSVRFRLEFFNFQFFVLVTFLDKNWTKPKMIIPIRVWPVKLYPIELMQSRPSCLVLTKSHEPLEPLIINLKTIKIRDPFFFQRCLRVWVNGGLLIFFLIFLYRFNVVCVYKQITL